MKALVFIIINIFIIIATELSGTLFFDRGIIHIIALVFVIAAAVPLARNYYLADPIFKKFLTAGIFAFFLFSASHISEFIQFRLSGGYNDHIFAITVNFYLTSILFMVLGSEIFLRASSGYHSSKAPILLTVFAIATLILFSFFFSIRPETISLEPESMAPYFYGMAAIISAFLFRKRILRLRKSLNPTFSGFFRFLNIMAVFVMVSIFFNIFYEFIEKAAKIPEYQIVYFSHFFFYGGLSIMFLAFEELLKLGGVLKDIREWQKNHKNKIKLDR
ncbi:MAG: hypothetical protein HYW69_02710 [Candidatus Nealsonbacteria bacterium]|nr:hypothetical protein [Candidatus Nealsonbacteria bacterium]